ncbi:hypothetical protein HDV57DRAFT_94274 [Trichoderma longibrachiatum]|uniref:Uncharacterized protein n=1 Tax=Trichoderma longibrachiatum ATCC 18648 TaxID=983965 RepID=A0A2T4BT15_TRILO|nr:hypothetical protein M440DRAFT_157448 [Trichoderma longibrachiatum ATCC 18648]
MARDGSINAVHIYKRGEPISGRLPTLYLWKIMQTLALFTSFGLSIFVAQLCNYSPFSTSDITPCVLSLLFLSQRGGVVFVSVVTVFFSCLFTTIRSKRRVLWAP